MSKTSIEWSKHPWNLFYGVSVKSEGLMKLMKSKVKKSNPNKLKTKNYGK